MKPKKPKYTIRSTPFELIRACGACNDGARPFLGKTHGEAKKLLLRAVDDLNDFVVWSDWLTNRGIIVPNWRQFPGKHYEDRDQKALVHWKWFIKHMYTPYIVPELVKYANTYGGSNA